MARTTHRSRRADFRMIETAQSYSPGECAVACGIPRRTVLRAIRAGELPALRFNARVVRVTRRDLLAWRINCTGQTPPAGPTRTSRPNSHKSG